MDVGNLISGSSAFSKSSLYIWKFLVHILLKPALKNFEHCFASVWDECNCVVVWTFFGIAFFGGLEWKLTLSSPVAIAEFKLDLEKAEEPEVKLPRSFGSSKNQESSRKTYISAIYYAKVFDSVVHNKLWKILNEMGIPEHLTFYNYCTF